jgi:hypothetical protein
MKLKNIFILAIFLGLATSLKAQINCDSTLLLINGVHIRGGNVSGEIIRKAKTIDFANTTLKIQSFKITLGAGIYKSVTNNGRRLGKASRRLLKNIRPGYIVSISTFVPVGGNMSDAICKDFAYLLTIASDKKDYGIYGPSH